MEIQQEPVDDLSGNVDDLNTYMELRENYLQDIEADDDRDEDDDEEDVPRARRVFI